MIAKKLVAVAAVALCAQAAPAVAMSLVEKAVNTLVANANGEAAPPAGKAQPVVPQSQPFAPPTAAAAPSMVPAQAAADPSAVVAVCPLTGPGIGACAVVGTVLHEGLQALNGKDAFGPGGEGMKILHGIGGVFTNGSQRNDGIPRMRTSTIRSQD